MTTKRTCCCCGNKKCKNAEYKYNSTSGSDCRICALGRTSINIQEFEGDIWKGAPSEPTQNQGDDTSGLWNDPEGDPDNLHMGDICFHRGPEKWSNYPTSDCEWNTCWDEEDYTAWFANAGAVGTFGPPEVSFYQFDSPMGLLPWSPQVFKDWIDNWGGPLLPQGDCTMHCTQDNIGCHTLAFVGAIGKNYGSADEGDTQPLCGSDIVTVPPPQEEWGWVRNWVRGGGKLIIMGESSGSIVEGLPGCRTKMGFFSPDQSYYIENCEDPLTQPENMDGEQVAEILRDFALFCGQREEEDEPEEFFEFENEEPGTENFINSYSEDEETGTEISCCQRTRRPFVKKDPEGVLRGFSFACSSSSGLIPKGNGQGIVGRCSGDGCTVVYKKNGRGAVVVVYDSNVWGGSSTQIPMEWWSKEASHPTHVELGLGGTSLKERSCNNDFWKFMCEEFLQDEGYSPSDCGDEVYWDNMESDNYKLGENPCLKTAACALPDGSCVETNVWDCFDHTDNERVTPGVWYGSSEIHPQGHGLGTCLTCDALSNQPFKLGVCCVKDPAECGDDCCASEDWFGGDLMYQYECECVIHEPDSLIKEVEWIPEDTPEFDGCNECYISGACCYLPLEENDELPALCVDDVRETVCGMTGPSGEGVEGLYDIGQFVGEDTECEEDTCVLRGACCGAKDYDNNDAPIACGVLDDLETGLGGWSEEDCDEYDGDWQGPNTSCDDCPTEGACCGSLSTTPCSPPDEGECLSVCPEGCQLATEEECVAFGLTYLPDELCSESPSPCECPSACCKGCNDDCKECVTVRPYVCEHPDHPAHDWVDFEGHPSVAVYNDSQEAMFCDKECFGCEPYTNLCGTEWDDDCYSPCNLEGCWTEGACCEQVDVTEVGCECFTVEGRECQCEEEYRESSFAQPSLRYRIIDLGGLDSGKGHPIASEALDINNNNMIVGRSMTNPIINPCCPDDCPFGTNCETQYPGWNAVMWYVDETGQVQIHQLRNEEDHPWSGAWKINDIGNIVGYGCPFMNPDDCPAYAWDKFNQNPTMLPPSNCCNGSCTCPRGFAINNSGTIVGQVSTVQDGRVSRWIPDTTNPGNWEWVEFEVPSAATSSSLTELNDTDMFIGKYTPINGYPTSVVWESHSSFTDSFTELPSFIGRNINNSGTIVGRAQSPYSGAAKYEKVGNEWKLFELPSYVWVDCPPEVQPLWAQEYDPPGKCHKEDRSGIAHDINNQGQIVGQTMVTTGGGGWATIWEGGERELLENLIVYEGNQRPWRLWTANAINNNGWIVGQGREETVDSGHGFVLIPITDTPIPLVGKNENRRLNFVKYMKIRTLPTNTPPEVKEIINGILKNPYDGNFPTSFSPSGLDCSADINLNGVVDIIDFLAVIDQWGGPGLADINNDGVVDVQDLLAVIDQWGPCPSPEDCFDRQDTYHEQDPFLLTDKPQFGTSVSIDGDWAIVGAPEADCTDGNDYTNCGAATIFKRTWGGTGGTWEQFKVLRDTNEENDFQFGNAVSISYDPETGEVTAVVSGRRCGFGDDCVSPGTVLIYEYSGSGDEWPETVITASDGKSEDGFGRALDIDGKTIVISNSERGLTCPALGGYSAQVYVVEKVGNSWIEQQILCWPEYENSSTSQGWDLSIDNKNIIIGSPFNSGEGHTGRVAIWNKQDNGVWEHVQTLAPSNYHTCTDGCEFGKSVSISGNVAVVGAPRDGGININQGSAYTYIHNGTSWVESGKIVPADNEASAFFGESVSTNSDIIVVGKPLEDGDGSAGSAYIFTYQKEYGGWTQVAKFDYENTDDNNTHEEFGHDVYVDSRPELHNRQSFVVGAPWARNTDIGNPFGGHGSAIFYTIKDECIPSDSGFYRSNAAGSRSTSGNKVWQGMETNCAEDSCCGVCCVDADYCVGESEVREDLCITWTQDACMEIDENANPPYMWDACPYVDDKTTGYECYCNCNCSDDPENCENDEAEKPDDWYIDCADLVVGLCCLDPGESGCTDGADCCEDEMSQEECSSAGGWFSEGNLCGGVDDNYCDYGACCLGLPDDPPECLDGFSRGECAELVEEQDIGGGFGGWGTQCDDALSPCELSACCFHDGAFEDDHTGGYTNMPHYCRNATLTDCQTMGGYSYEEPCNCGYTNFGPWVCNQGEDGGFELGQGACCIKYHVGGYSTSDWRGICYNISEEECQASIQCEILSNEGAWKGIVGGWQGGCNGACCSTCWHKGKSCKYINCDWDKSITPPGPEYVMCKWNDNSGVSLGSCISNDAPGCPESCTQLGGGNAPVGVDQDFFYCVQPARSWNDIGGGWPSDTHNYHDCEKVTGCCMWGSGEPNETEVAEWVTYAECLAIDHGENFLGWAPTEECCINPSGVNNFCPDTCDC